MANLDFCTTPFVEFDDTKIFGTADTAANFAKVAGDDVSLQRKLSALQRGPVRFYQHNVIALNEDVADYLMFVVTGGFAVAGIGGLGRTLVKSLLRELAEATD